MRASLFILIGVVFGAAVASALTVHIARMTLSEIRHLHRVILEVKRRMSVAHVETGGPRVSFSAGGDPEGYSQSMGAFMGDGNVVDWIRYGRIYDWTEADERATRAAEEAVRTAAT